MIVADCNLVAYLLIAGRHTPAAEAVHDKDPQWVAPPLLRSEFLNVLVSSLRARVITLDEALGAMRDVTRLVTMDHAILPEHVLDLAVASRCTAYDCEYVALARSLHVTLVTSDRQVIAAFPETALSMDAFIAGARP